MKKSIVIFMVLTLLCLTMVGCSSGEGGDYTSSHVGTVTDKAIKRYNDEDKYLIFVKLDDGTKVVYENTDALFLGKFNSSDIYGELEVGKKYRFETYGVRVEALSMYENIISVDELQ